MLIAHKIALDPNNAQATSLARAAGVARFAGRAKYPQFRKKGQHERFSLTLRFHTIGIEDLNLRGMVKNRCLARSIADMGFFEFRRQLQYKAAMRGRQVVVADRWFASSKTCSSCRHKLEPLPLSVRQWTCPECAASHDRDINAAMNLKQVADSSAGDCQRIPPIAAVCSVTACGEEGAGSGRKTRMKPASVKQEISNRFAQK